MRFKTPTSWPRGMQPERKPDLITPQIQMALEDFTRRIARAVANEILGELAARNFLTFPAAAPSVENKETTQIRAALPETGFLRLRDLVADRKRGTAGLIPVSPATWYGWIARGFAPKPVKFGQASVWRAEDIRAFIQRCSSGIPSDHTDRQQLPSGTRRAFMRTEASRDSKSVR